MMGSLCVACTPVTAFYNYGSGTFAFELLLRLLVEGARLQKLSLGYLTCTFTDNYNAAH